MNVTCPCCKSIDVAIPVPGYKHVCLGCECEWYDDLRIASHCPHIASSAEGTRYCRLAEGRELVGAAARVVLLHDSPLGEEGRAEAIAILKAVLNGTLNRSPNHERESVTRESA